VVDVKINGETRHYARDALLARPDVTSVEIVHDIAYGKAMRFRAIPLSVLLPGLETQPSPAARWPALGVDPTLPATHPVRAGQALFVTQCLPCHTLNGAGSSTLGPD
jgi:mono/diheme cytochrome c family protein